MARTMIALTCLCLSLFLIDARIAFAATEIYFARHAQTMGNLTHHHSSSNDRTLSPKGRTQVQQLTRQLAMLNIDVIVVSPKIRVLKTILPYLRKQRKQAEIWPELAECCWQKHRQSSAGKPERGSNIDLDRTMQPYFIFPKAEDRLRYRTNGYGEGMTQTFMASDRVRKRFAYSNQRILIVGHYHAGARLLEILLGQEPIGRYKIGNTQIIHLHERNDGTFILASGL